MAIERRVAGDIRISESNSDVSALPSTASSDEPSTATNDPTMRAQSILIRLYVSHTVSAWNSRMFEFGAVLFLASVLPGTLLYASIYALVRAFSAAALSSWLGAWVDQSDRLVALRHSIVWQRAPVAASCLCFIALTLAQSWPVTLGLFMILCFLACVEKLAATANTVAVERDWAIVIAENIRVPRQDLNASLRRIDLGCKLIAPVFISLIDSLWSTRLAVWTVLCLNTVSVLLEYVTISQVYRWVPALKRASVATYRADLNEETTQFHHRISRSRSLSSYVQDAVDPWKEYVTSRVFLASFALSLLYLTVLSFGGTMVTYLLHSGYRPLEISCMRLGSVAAELSGTWTAPLVMNRIGPIRSGLWFLNWQFCCVAGAAAMFFLWDSSSQLIAGMLVVGVALSRIGLWGFDLSAQFLVQENIEEHARGRFSGTEMALQNMFEMLSFASTIVFARPEQFRYPVIISAGAVTLAAACFAAYTRKERGHLLHRSKCLGGDKKGIYRRVELEESA